MCKDKREVWQSPFFAPFEGMTRALDLQTGETGGAIDKVAHLQALLLDLTSPEYLWLRRTAQYSIGINQGAGAGNTTIELANPAGSGMIASVGVTVFNTAGALANIGYQTSGAAVIGGAAGWEVNNDTRQLFGGASQGLPVCRCFAQVAAGVVLTPRIQLQNAAVFQFPFRFILMPGFKLMVSQVTVAQGLCALFEWTERPFAPPEAR